MNRLEVRLMKYGPALNRPGPLARIWSAPPRPEDRLRIISERKQDAEARRQKVAAFKN